MLLSVRKNSSKILNTFSQTNGDQKILKDGNNVSMGSLLCLSELKLQK